MSIITFLYIFTGLLHLVYSQEMELNIISEANFSTLWPFSFFPWLLSLALCPIQFFYTNSRLLNFSPTLIDSEVNIIKHCSNCIKKYKTQIVCSIFT